MTHRLTRDEFDALDQVDKSPKSSKTSVCVARNAKHLVGIKFLVVGKDGGYAMTGKGSEALLVNRCVAGLRALSVDANFRLDAAVAGFLGRKGHIVASNAAGGFDITPKGRECLEDIAQNP